MRSADEQDRLRPVILIVEDHDALRNSLKNWLACIFQDCGILLARSGEDALNKVLIQSPDIVLMDVLLPGMNGINAAGRIMEMAPHAKVIMLSIYEDAAYQADAASAGTFAYVPKRKMGNELIPMITRLLRETCGQRIEDPTEVGR